MEASMPCHTFCIINIGNLQEYLMMVMMTDDHGVNIAGNNSRVCSGFCVVTEGKTLCSVSAIN